MIDYTLLPRRQVTEATLALGNWTTFISAYNSSPRVNAVWRSVKAPTRIWGVHREYAYHDGELPQDGRLVKSDGIDEAEFAFQLLEAAGGQRADFGDERILVDITGFMRAELVALVRGLKDSGVRNVDFLYSEPNRYARKGWTAFSMGNVQAVRQVIGCEGVHEIETSNDLLVVGTGYDDALMASVAEHKPHARKALIVGLPSLLPDMYQENVWRVSRAAESIGYGFSSEPTVRYAPANDPFVTASVVRGLVDAARTRDGVENVYLAPLGTKAQALGFALYFATEGVSAGNTSVVLPIVERYGRETSSGVGRIWLYSIPFHMFL